MSDSRWSESTPQCAQHPRFNGAARNCARKAQTAEGLADATASFNGAARNCARKVDGPILVCNRFSPVLQWGRAQLRAEGLPFPSLPFPQ